MKRTFLKTTKNLLCSCAMIGGLALGQAWSSGITEADIVSPCVYPKVSTAHESGERLNDEFFNHEKNAFNDSSRKESVLMWLDRGGDKREAIQDTKAFPYSTQVYFTVRFPRSQRDASEIGTGTLIDKDVILTAAHVVYSHDKGGYYTALRCIAAPNGSSAPFGISEINNVKVAPQYIQKGPHYKGYDYALVFLKDFLGEKTGYMGLATLGDEGYQNLKLTIAGYPADKIEHISSPSMWGMSGDLKSFTPEELYHNIDTYGGQSGSGMWCQREKGGNLEYYLVGVHAYGTEAEGNYNYGPRLTNPKAQEILGWIRDFKDNKLRFENKVRMAKKTLEGNVIGEEEQDMSVSSAEFKTQDIIAELRPVIKGIDGIEWYDWGLKYLNGTGVNRDADKAHECFAEAFERFQRPESQENIEVLHRLAVMYNLGRYVNHKNHFKAVEYWKKAADKGHPKAQSNLALMFEKGEGIGGTYTIEERFQTAFKYYEQAAFQGNGPAQYNLAEMYEQGKGVEGDKVRAVEWYKKSFNSGWKDAHRALERLSNQGITEAQTALKEING